MDLKHILDAIRTTRNSQNKKQLEMSILLGISQNHYSDIETGKHKLGIEMLERIEHVLGRDYREFLPPPESTQKAQM